jgi:hypothetical protein
VRPHAHLPHRVVVPSFQLGLCVQRGGDREALLVEEGGLAGDLGEVLLQRVPARFGGEAGQQGAQAGQALGEDADEQVLLAREVLVERGFRAAGRLGDLLGGGAGQADGEHQLVGGVEDADAGGFLHGFHEGGPYRA